MKNYMLIGAFWVLGLVLGSVWHQSELSLSRAEIARLNRELASKTRRNLIPDMTRMIAVPETRAHRFSTITSAEPDTLPSGTGDIPRDRSRNRESGVEMNQEEFAKKMAELLENSESPEDAFAILSDMWQTRRSIALASLIDHLGLTPREVADFEAVVGDMNDTLADKLEDVFDRFAYMEEEPSPEDAFRMVHDFTGVFVATYDNLDDALPGNWRFQTGGPLDLTAFLDPGIFKPMMRFDGGWGDR